MKDFLTILALVIAFIIAVNAIVDFFVYFPASLLFLVVVLLVGKGIFWIINRYDKII